MARLSRDTIVDAAIRLADRDGLDALSMRKLGREVAADPMSLYHHVGDKDGLLAAMIDAVIAEIEIAPAGGDWRDAVRTTVLAARRTMSRHPWAAGVLARQADPTPAGLRYLDRVLGILRDGGFSIAVVHHAIHVLGSRLLGFSQDLYDDGRGDPPPEQSAAQGAAWAVDLPRLAELAGAVSHEGGLGGCDTDVEFEFALDLILEGLERRRTAA